MLLLLAMHLMPAVRALLLMFAMRAMPAMILMLAVPVMLFSEWWPMMRAMLAVLAMLADPAAAVRDLATEVGFLLQAGGRSCFCEGAEQRSGCRRFNAFWFRHVLLVGRFPLAAAAQQARGPGTGQRYGQRPARTRRARTRAGARPSTGGAPHALVRPARPARPTATPPTARLCILLF